MPDVDSTQVDGVPAQLEPERYAAGVLINEKYLLEARLGRGGMGTVWLAHNVLLDSPVALKMIDPSMQRKDTIERFRFEAHVEARFNHPNIVRVFDYGHTELGDPFMVMEVLDGISLGDLIRQRGRLGAAEAVQLVLPIIDALCYVHARGVVHRDLKPDNILLSRNDVDVHPKLLDFGVAKLASEDARECATEACALIGSPSYMAPEQVRASDGIDHRADIWAMCAVLYEAVCGRQAFPGQGVSPLRAVIEARVLPLEDTGEGERELFCVLARGLEKDRALRFQSMFELGSALAQWLHDRGVCEDLNGGRLSRTWNVAGAERAPEAQPLRPRRVVEEIDVSRMGDDATLPGRNAAQSAGRMWCGRTMLAAAIVLTTIAVPANTRLETTITPRDVSDMAQHVFARALAASAELHALIAR